MSLPFGEHLLAKMSLAEVLAIAVAMAEVEAAQAAPSGEVDEAAQAADTVRPERV